MSNSEALEKYSKDNKIWITELDEIPGYYIIWNPRNLRMIRNDDNYFTKSLLLQALEEGYEIKFNQLPIEKY